MILVVGAFVPAVSGAGVISVGSGSPISNAGVKPGDLITQVDRMNMTDLTTIFGPNTTLKAGQFVNLTVYRDGRTLHFNSIKLACCVTIVNLKTGKNITYPYIGIGQSVTPSNLRSIVSTYVTPLNNLWQYVCIPTLPPCQTRVPFSDTLGGFYSSPLGPNAAPLASLLYWVFFLNFNLAIFNALPIFPLDGGQAFLVIVKAISKGRLSEPAQMRITSAATLVVVALILTVVTAPYLYALF
jgi:membrane-associated protease RseP (regulator of RpoE activity)